MDNPDTVLGCAVMQCADMPAISKGNIVMAFADFKSAYQVVDRHGIRMLRDPYTDKPFVKYYTTKRVGGDVTNFEAVKLLKVSA
jgi:HK97 family phage major capsid protein